MLSHAGRSLPAEIHVLPLTATQPPTQGRRALWIEPRIQACPPHSPSHSTSPSGTSPDSPELLPHQGWLPCMLATCQALDAFPEP